jgi:hypothetical protein
MANEVTAYTFVVDDPDDASRIATIVKGTPRSDETDRVLRREDGSIADHVYVAADEVAAAPAAAPATFGEVNEATGEVEEHASTGLGGGADSGEIEPPARNDTTDAWRAFAQSVGVDVAPDTGRDAIIAELERRGLA